jgi:peptide/histidine transporter 3/4
METVVTPIKTPAASPDGDYAATIWDARPRKYKSVLFEVTTFILMMELAERLSYFGINQGLKNFMQQIGWSLVSASALKSTWTSICYLMPLFGAYLADERWGRFRVILTFGIWYCVGDFLVAIAAYPSIMENEAAVNPIFVIGLFLGIGVGTGCIKSSVVTLGADQFDPNDPHEVKQKDTYFSYFYWCVNVGSGVSYGYFSILCVEGSPQIPAEYGYFATYMICAGVMALAVCFFVLGSPRYVHMPPNDRTISTLLKLCWANSRITFKGKVLVYGSLCYIAAIVVNIAAAFTSSVDTVGDVFAYIAGVLVVVGIVSWVYVGMDPSFLDASRISNGGLFEDHSVTGYQRLVRVLPFAALTIIWQCAYDQTDANFQSITQQCDLRLDTSDPDSSQIPGAMLGVFDPIVIVIVIPILDSFVYPMYTKTFGRPPTQFGKVVTGLCIAVVGLFWTACFEIIRRNAGPLLDSEGNYIRDGGSDQPMNDILWAAAIPNYVFIALGECLINVTAFDVFYSNVPLTLKSSSQSLNLLMSSVGSILTSVFTIMFSKYLPSDDLNEGHLEYMFFCIASLSVVNLIAFVIIMKKMNFAMEVPNTMPQDGLLSEKVSVSSRQSYVSTK